MNTFTLKRIDTDSFTDFYCLLEQDFCLLERKTADRELRALEDERFCPCWIEQDGRRIGYICYWRLDGYVYVEHFAMCRQVRGLHLGTAFLSELLAEMDLPVVLEVERPTDEVTRKRIGFYRYLGFALNTYDYYQPSYHPGQPLVPMYVCSYNEPLTEQQYEKVTKQIKEVVYH